MTPATEKRKQVLRRQFNQAFASPDGSFSVSKTLAVFAQIATLYYFGKSFDALVDKPESLLIVLSFLVAPDVIKKALSMKYGASNNNGH